MYVCVFFPFILDIKFIERTSRGHTGGRSHRRKVTQEEGHTGFLIHLLSAVRALILSREGFSHSSPSSSVKSNFVY